MNYYKGYEIIEQKPFAAKVPYASRKIEANSMVELIEKLNKLPLIDTIECAIGVKIYSGKAAIDKLKLKPTAQYKQLDRYSEVLARGYINRLVSKEEKYADIKIQESYVDYIKKGVTLRCKFKPNKYGFDIINSIKLFKDSFMLDFIVDDEEYLPELLLNNASIEKLQKAYENSYYTQELLKF